jgi:hypothetical protein
VTTLEKSSERAKQNQGLQHAAVILSASFTLVLAGICCSAHDKCLSMIGKPELSLSTNFTSLFIHLGY